MLKRKSGIGLRAGLVRRTLSLQLVNPLALVGLPLSVVTEAPDPSARNLNTSTVSNVVRRICYAIYEHMGPSLIHLPKTEEVKEKTNKSFDVWQFPQCLGAVDGTHIDIKQPSDNASDYINRKGRYSLNVQEML